MTRNHQIASPWWLLPPGRVSPLWWVVVGAALLWIDYMAGPDGPFPVLYVIPITLSAWYSGRALHRHVHRLEGLLPICCFCKSIRTKTGDWEPLETYISKRSEAQFSHGFCPPCGEEHYPEIDHRVSIN